MTDTRSEKATPASQRPKHFLSSRRAIGRLLRALGVGALAALLLPETLAPTLQAIVVWNAAAFALLSQVWFFLLRSDASETERRAGDEDPGGAIVSTIAVMASLFSLFATTWVLKTLKDSGDPLWVGLAVLSVALSWCVVHTSFTVRYAHLYYRDNSKGGLIFPGDEAPSDLDFLYYAFTIGMCFQVSDVQISSRQLRATSLAHALLSFVFNTTIVALALNLMFQLFGG